MGFVIRSLNHRTDRDDILAPCLECDRCQKIITKEHAEQNAQVYWRDPDMPSINLDSREILFFHFECRPGGKSEIRDWPWSPLHRWMQQFLNNYQTDPLIELPRPKRFSPTRTPMRSMTL